MQPEFPAAGKAVTRKGRHYGREGIKPLGAGLQSESWLQSFAPTMTLRIRYAFPWTVLAIC